MGYRQRGMTISACRTRTKGLRPRRSRHGCRNCKLRKVKVGVFLRAFSLPRFLLIRCLCDQCDEARPHCRSCRSYGVVCNFAADVPDLQLSAEARPQKLPSNSALAAQSASRALCPSPRVSIVSSIITHASAVPFELDSKQVRLLYQFRYWMASSWGGAMDGSSSWHIRYVLRSHFLAIL